MGLTVCVGISADDFSGGLKDKYEADFRLINRILKDAGYPAHKERLPASEGCWALGIGSYGSLHFLRRFAAGIALNGKAPEPLRQNAQASAAPEIEAYRERRKNGELGPVYDHLMFHSDAEGYYVPVDFPEVLNPTGAVYITGGALGSSVRLGQECETLAGHLGLPATDFDLDDDDEWKRLKKATPGAVWHKYPIEAFVCATLRLACEESVRRRAAIVFG
jgi:hypothetical protein